MLERLANTEKPPLDIDELEAIRIEFMDPKSDKAALRGRLKGMADAFQERGELTSWHHEMLDAIDECFVEHFMTNGNVSTALFVPDSATNANSFSAYCDAVDEKLRGKLDQRPKYAREYFAYYSIWQMQGYSFPVPLGTKSVVQSLNMLAHEFNAGFVEVRHLIRLYCVPRIGTFPYAAQNHTSYRCESVGFVPRIGTFPYAAQNHTSYRCESVGFVPRIGTFPYAAQNHTSYRCESVGFLPRIGTFPYAAHNHTSWRYTTVCFVPRMGTFLCAAKSNIILEWDLR